MRISHQNKFIFLALPRTGSTTVRNVLDEYSDIKSIFIRKTSTSFPFYHHITASELKAIFISRGWDWDSYARFCVVRNPYDRVVSLYHHHLGMRKRFKNKSFLHNARDILIPPPSFDKFVFRLNHRKGLPISLDNFIRDAQPEAPLLVDNVLMFERLKEELPAFLNTIGIHIGDNDIPHLNSSDDRSEYQKYYCEETKRHIEELYRYEIERFGYSF